MDKNDVKVSLSILILLGIVAYCFYGFFSFTSSLHHKDVKREERIYMEYKRDSLQAEYYKSHLKPSNTTSM